MKFELTNTISDALLITLSGEFDALGTVSIRKTLEETASSEEHQHIVIDLSRVIFIDSSGIGAIVFLFKRLRQKQRTLEITGVQGQPRELFELLRIHKAIPTSWLVSTDIACGGK